MRKSICIPYCVDQHRPSVPLNFIVDLPDDIEKRDALLKSLFIKHVCADFGPEDITVEARRDADDFGDLIVYLNDDLFLYVTYID